MFAGFVLRQHSGHDRLFSAQLCGEGHYGAALQELRPLLPPDRTGQRGCKNCGRYFPQTGRVSAEYCERPVPRGQQTCREAGAFQQWTKKQSDDPVFKAYRKEYKKRFAWIKAGRISDTDFYAWSEQAREMKKKCDRDVITLEEYVEWLKNS